MILAIVQARMASTRLAGKVLRPIDGKPMIGYLFERLKMSEKIQKIVLATSVDSSNDPLCGYVQSLNLDIYRGDEQDVLDRFYQAALKFSATTIVRITADCPLIDPVIVDQVIALYENGGFDYVRTSGEPPAFPDGLDTEVFNFTSLEAAWKNACLNSEREHVTPYILKSNEFKKTNLIPQKDYSNERWTVDNEEDFILIRTLLEDLYSKGAYFGMNDILKYKKTNPLIFKINEHINRNEGYKKSLRNDSNL